ncbi:MAG: mechanosensitive ion channel, partial [Chitinophagaceae bacterium]
TVGENVVMQGQEGTVTSIQLFYTTILTFDNKTIIVPNGQLSNNVVINLSRQGKRRLDITLKLPYTAAFEQVRTTVETAMSAQHELLKEPKARIGIEAMEFDKYEVIIQVWVNAHGFQDARYILQERIMTDLRSSGVIAGGK